MKRIFPECHIGFTIAEYRAGDPDIAAVRARCSRVDEWFKGDTEFGFKKLNQWSGRFVNAFTNGIDHCSHCIYHFYGGDAAYGVGPSGFARIRNFAKIFPEVADKRIWITEWRERSDEDCRCQQMFSSTLFKAHYELQCLNDPIVDASSLHQITALSGGFCLANGRGRWYVQWDPAGRDFIDPDWTGHPRLEVGPAGPMFMLYNEALLGHPIILKHGANLNQGPGSSCWNGSTFYGGWTSQMIGWHTRGEPEGGKPKWSSGGPEWIAAVNPEKNSLVLLICNTWTVPWRPSVDIPGFRVNGKLRQRTFSCPEEEVCLHQIPGEPRPTTLDDEQIEPDAINIPPFGIATIEFNIERAAARVGLLGDASEDLALNAKAEAFFATNSIVTILQAGENPGRFGGKDEPYGTFEIKGFTFITAPEFPDKTKYEKLVADAVAKVGKDMPVFLLQHRAPFGTTVRSTEYDGYDHYKDDPKALTRAFLDKHPNLIVLSGHNHTDARDERAIWQGAFTAVDCGCLTRTDDVYVANPTPSHVCSNVLTLALFDDRATFTRYSLTSGLPVGRDWTVRWPFDAKSAPYRAEVLTNRCEVGGFEGKVSVEAEEHGGIKVSFPVGFANGYFAQTGRYRVELFLQERGEEVDPEEARFTEKNEKKEVKWIPVSLCDVPGNWICRDAPRGWWRNREARTVTFSGALFAPADQIKVVVTPESFAGTRGNPIEFEGKPPALKPPKYETVWSGGTCTPPAAAFAGAAGTRFRVSFEFASDRDARLDLEKVGGGKVSGGFTLPGLGLGAGELRRYALEFRKEAEGDAYALVISKTLAEKASVSNVRVDRLVN